MCVMNLSIIVMIVSALLAHALLNRRHCTNMSSVDVEMIDVHCMLATENSADVHTKVLSPCTFHMHELMVMKSIDENDEPNVGGAVAADTTVAEEP